LAGSKKLHSTGYIKTKMHVTRKGCNNDEITASPPLNSTLDEFCLFFVIMLLSIKDITDSKSACVHHIEFQMALNIHLL
jgi:hypothetical protein